MFEVMAAVADVVFREYVDTYREAISGARYAELGDLQPAPFATLAHGGPGTAYALWRLGLTRTATAWITGALADRRRSSFHAENELDAGTSFVYGRPGIYWVQARLGGKSRARAIAGFMRAARACPPRELELMSGTAGLLAGARILLEDGDDARLRELAGSLADRLARRVRARAKQPWQPLDPVGFAHHWPGVLHALLAWLCFAGEEVPAWLAGALRDLLAVWTPEATRAPGLAASWCNGAAGAALLWVKAHEATGDAVYLEAARRAGEQAATAKPAGSDLCCGNGGVAFALLELERIDPRGTWHARARELAARAIDRPAMKWPNGLYRGHPGLVCLALDVLGDAPRGFPAVLG